MSVTGRPIISQPIEPRNVGHYKLVYLIMEIPLCYRYITLSPGDRLIVGLIIFPPAASKWVREMKSMITQSRQSKLVSSPSS